MKRFLLRQMSVGILISGLGILSTGFSCIPTAQEATDEIAAQPDSYGSNFNDNASNGNSAEDDAGQQNTEAGANTEPQNENANTAVADNVVTGSISEGGSGAVIDVDASGAITAKYQPGVNGYQSAKSVAISTMYAENYNMYQGTLFTDEADTCIGDMPAHYYSESPLIRFDDLNIPANAQVLAATITFTFVDVYDGGGQRVTGHYLKVPWALAQGYGGSGVGWVYRDNGIAWGAPGARGEGTDIYAGKSFQSKALAEGPYQKDTIVLDTEIVQSWVSDPSQNFGIVLGVNIPDHHVGYRQPNNTHVEDRPILSITYTIPS